MAINKADAVAHCRQAQEYLRAAEHSLEIGDLNAAGTAVDACINAADAVAGMNLGRRWKGPHEQASQLVAGAAMDETSPRNSAGCSHSRRNRTTARSRSRARRRPRPSTQLVARSTLLGARRAATTVDESCNIG